MKSFIKEPAMMMILLVAFTPLAFILMPVIALFSTAAAVALMFVNWHTPDGKKHA